MNTSTRVSTFPQMLLLLLYGSSSIIFFVSCTTILPPLPLLPLPEARQLKWQQREQIIFFHFGINTFTDSEWGTGLEEPTLFDPRSFDARQWVHVAKAAGFSLVVLTAKHHDGFCLWPSKYTTHSVKSCSWQNGHGDVVRSLSEAAKEEGIDLGLYLSPWDRHDPRYGKTKLYNEYYMAQLHELLTEYGTISEIWFDGAKGSNAPAMKYMFKKWFSLTHELQQSANVFSDAGPDVRWVGDERGAAGTTCWSMMNRSQAKIGLGADQRLLNTGDRYGKDWVPPECDVSIRPGWFWHKKEEPKSLQELLSIYYHSVGRNCVLLLNVPPNSSGLLSAEDVGRLMEFRGAIRSIFSRDLARGATARASSRRGRGFGPENVLREGMDEYWAAAEDGREGRGEEYVRLEMEGEVVFNVVKIQEAIGMGQRVARYRVKVREEGGRWSLFCNGTTIGYKRLHRECTVKARAVMLIVDEARAPPLISSFALYLDSLSPPLPHCTS